VAALRDQILMAFVARLALIPTWVVALRDKVNFDPGQVRGIVYQVAEEKQFANDQQYDCTLHAGVLITCHDEDADDALDGNGTAGSANPYRYLDRMVTLAEKAVHTPDDWDIDGEFTRVQVLGHDVVDPDESLQREAVLHVDFKFRCQVTDPGVS
jgi:hypothetical protein